MHQQLILHRDGAPTERVDLAHPVVLGGPAGALLPGGEPAALLFVPSASGAVVEAQVACARAAGRPLQPGTRRLLRPGERAECMGTVIELEPPQPAEEGTRALAGLLLREAAGGAAPVAGAHLVVLEGPLSGVRIPLGPSQTLGRGRGATIRLPDSMASRVHASIRAVGEAIHVEDLGSKNGICLNGRQMRSRFFRAQPGDEIVIGSTALVLAASAGPSPGYAAMNSAPRPVRKPAIAGPKALALASAAALLAAAGLGIAATRAGFSTIP